LRQADHLCRRRRGGWRRRDHHHGLGPALATPEAKTAFLFTRVGLAGCDMGACAMLPRIIGQGRAAELLYTGRTMSADEGERWGYYNRAGADS
jgi:enoyl-CoA hydratase/carnithine racemase